MSAESFVDTNMLIYAASGAFDEPAKYRCAWEIIDNGTYAISGQLLAHVQRDQISYWGAALIAGAEAISIPTLYTEDLNHGQKYGTVTVINPFKVN